MCTQTWGADRRPTPCCNSGHFVGSAISYNDPRNATDVRSQGVEELSCCLDGWSHSPLAMPNRPALVMFSEWEGGKEMERAHSGGYPASAGRWDGWIGAPLHFRGTPIHTPYPPALAEKPQTELPPPSSSPPILKTMPGSGLSCVSPSLLPVCAATS